MSIWNIIKVVEYEQVWQNCIQSGIVNIICTASLLLAFGAMGIKIFLDVYKGEGGFNVSKIYGLVFISVLTALFFGNAGIYGVVGKSIISLFNAFSRFTETFGDKSREHIQYLVWNIQAQADSGVNFFSPKAWIADMATIMLSLSTNVTMIILLFAVSIAPLQLLFALLFGPFAAVLSIALGKDVLIKWMLFIFATITLQIAISVAFMIIGDSAIIFNATELTSAGNIQAATNTIILCLVLVGAVPIIHGAIFQFNINPLRKILMVLVFPVGIFVVTTKLLSRQKKRIGNTTGI